VARKTAYGDSLGVHVHDLTVTGAAEGMACRALVSRYIFTSHTTRMTIAARAVSATAMYALTTRGTKHRGMTDHAAAHMVIRVISLTVNMATETAWVCCAMISDVC